MFYENGYGVKNMRRVSFLLLFTLVLLSCNAAQSRVEVSVELLDFLGFSATQVVKIRNWQASEVPGEPVFLVYRVTIQGRHLIGDDQGALYDTSSKTLLIVTEQLQRVVDELISVIKAQAFGVPLNWDQSNKHFPRMGYATVVDLETGKQFKVQRRAGSEHADVQPLTREDTAVMKDIYGGQWSWDRRAIILITDTARIAASMNGMPHGQGALQNNFKGHFCIHFMGCTTHGGSAPDPGHQLMVSKSAGTIWSMARKATPEEQVRNFVWSLNEKDFWLASQFSRPREYLSLESALKTVQTIQVKQTVLSGPTADTANIQCSGEVIYCTGQRRRFECEVRLYNKGQVWLVEPEFILTIATP